MRSLILAILLFVALPVAAQSPANPSSVDAQTKLAHSQAAQSSPSEFFPLKAGLRYVYSATYERKGESTRDQYVIVSKSIQRGGNELIYFTEESESQKSIQIIAQNHIGLGAYLREKEGVSTFDCFWLGDLSKIPPKKPHLFLRYPVAKGDAIRLMSDTGDAAHIYTVIGFEPVVVPAGTFNDALKLSMKTVRADGSSEEGFAWFAKGVGLVKRIRETGREEDLVRWGSLDSEPFQTRSVDRWAGVKFIFLPMRKTFQRFGYQSLHQPGDDRHALPYAKYQGRIATVTKVTAAEQGLKLELSLDDNHENVTADVYSGTVRGIAPIEDINNARQMYQGKTLYSRWMLTTYNEELDETGVSTLSRYTSLLVRTVIAGWEDDAPVRFMVTTEAGFDGFIDVHMSDTNIAEELRKYNRFEEIFALNTPDKLETRLVTDETNDVDYTKVFTAEEVTSRAVITAKPEPAYPIGAKERGFTGEVVLKMVLGADGRVSNIVPVGQQAAGLPESAKAAAITAATKLQFQPAMKNGHRVSQYVSVVYNFYLP